jgi:hypothetical protein
VCYPSSVNLWQYPQSTDIQESSSKLGDHSSYCFPLCRYYWLIDWLIDCPWSWSQCPSKRILCDPKPPPWFTQLSFWSDELPPKTVECDQLLSGMTQINSQGTKATPLFG